MDTGKYFAVVDTETTYSNRLMSIGIAISERSLFTPSDLKYYIIMPECNEYAMYSAQLMVNGVSVTLKDSRRAVMSDIKKVFRQYGIKSIFAYNAKFDHSQMPEFSDFDWYDIMGIAAYRQYNRALPQDGDFYSTGRLKRNYGVEPILRLLSKKSSYHEVHNALCDAVDELKIMKLLGQPIEVYDNARI